MEENQEEGDESVAYIEIEKLQDLGINAGGR